MILAEHSKAQTQAIIEWVGDSQNRFDSLFHLFLNDEYRVVQRAAWPISYCIIKHPELIQKHFRVLVTNLYDAKLPGAVKRNTLRLLQYVEIPEIKEEVKIIIEDRWDVETPAFRSRAKKFMASKK
jgi:hypothetical protein